MLDAYLLQFQDNFSMFLKSRSEEMIAGGRMVLSFMGRSSANPSAPESCYQWELLARALMTMASEVHYIYLFFIFYFVTGLRLFAYIINKENRYLTLFKKEIDWDGGEATNN